MSKEHARGFQHIDLSAALVARCGAPAAVLALIVLLPFLKTSFMIDDVTFLLQSQHILSDPLHPTAFAMVFHGERVRVSHQLVSGPVMAYLLIPSVLSGGSEWLAHAMQLVFLVLGTMGTAALALRLGLDRIQATCASLLVVVSPAVLGMATTAMPDIPAMAFGVVGMERVIAWKHDRRWRTGIEAALCLALATLARPHLLLLFICAGLFLLMNGQLRGGPDHRNTVSYAIAPLVIGLVIVVGIVLLTRDRTSGDTLASAATNLSNESHVTENLATFALHWVVAFPLAILWPLLRGRRFLNSRRTYAAYGLGMALLLSGFHLIPDWRWTVLLIFCVCHGIDVLADLIIDGWQRRDRIQLLLTVWLLMAAAAAPYVQLPAKLLIPAAPAMAILLARKMNVRERANRFLSVFGVTATVSVVAGVLLLRAEAAFAAVGRDGGAITSENVKAGRTVWMDGAWGFQWYAQRAGAQALAKTAPFPNPGDVVVAGQQAHVLNQFPNKTLLSRHVYQTPGLRIMSEGAGFFSNVIGWWPLVWGHRELDRIEVWRIDSAASLRR